MIRGLCASKAPWYNVSLASSLFPSQLPPLPKHAISEYVGLAYIREDRDFAFDGGSSACATIAAVCLMFVFKLMIFWSFHSYNLQNSFARLLGFTCMPCETECGQQYFSVTMAVAGILSFSIVAQFDDDTVIIGCEHQQDAQAIARALGIHQFNSLNVLEPVPGRVQEWRVVSWFTRCNASLTSFTICACSTSGFEVKMGWIGAITVGQDVPVSVAAAPADHNCISARACASRKVMSLQMLPETKFATFSACGPDRRTSFFHLSMSTSNPFHVTMDLTMHWVSEDLLKKPMWNHFVGEAEAHLEFSLSQTRACLCRSGLF